MPDYLLLAAAGAFWICGIVGVCILWSFRRSGRRSTTAQDSGRGESSALKEARMADSDRAVLPPSEAGDNLLPHALRCFTEDANSAVESSEFGRSSPLRFPYRHRQWVAACPQGRLPEADDFVAVNCQELFGDGVSFYSESMCSAETVVVTLGTHDRMIFMLARVISEVSKPSGSPAAYLIECRFIRRIRENTARWAWALSSARVTQLA